jgi:hypothetical protein
LCALLARLSGFGVEFQYFHFLSRGYHKGRGAKLGEKGL